MLACYLKCVHRPHHLVHVAPNTHRVKKTQLYLHKLNMSLNRKKVKIKRICEFKKTFLSGPTMWRARDGTRLPDGSLRSGSTMLSWARISLLGSAITGYVTLHPGCIHKNFGLSHLLSFDLKRNKTKSNIEAHSIGFNIFEPLAMRLDRITRQTQKLHSFAFKLRTISSYLAQLRGAHRREIG